MPACPAASESRLATLPGIDVSGSLDICVDRAAMSSLSGLWPIYVVQTNGGLIAKHSTWRGRAWELASVNPAVAPEPWPEDAEVIGEVAWAAQTLI